MCVAYFFQKHKISFFCFQCRLVYVNFDMNPYVPKRVVDPLKRLICGQKLDRLLLIDISMYVIILNNICLLLLDDILGNIICAFSKSFSVHIICLNICLLIKYILKFLLKYISTSDFTHVYQASLRVIKYTSMVNVTEINYTLVTRDGKTTLFDYLCTTAYFTTV